MADRDNATPQRILIVRPSALGDVARSVCALVSLRRRFPEARIDWLVRDSFAEVVAHHPDLNGVRPFPRSRFRGFFYRPNVAGEVWRFLRSLGEQGYDRVYDLQGLSRSGIFTRATRSPHRVGPSNARELAWLSYTRRVDVGAATHTVDQMLAIVAGDGVEPVADLQLHVSEADRAWAADQLDRQGLTPDRYFVIAPTTKWLSKRWPADRFAKAIKRMGDAGLHGVAVVGSTGEEDQAAPLRQALSFGREAHVTPLWDLIGATTVGQMMAVIERAGLVLSNDSAALHIAIGLGRRCLGVFGPTDPAKVGPYRYDIGVVQTPAAVNVRYRASRLDQALISRVNVDQVVIAAKRVLHAPPPRPAAE